MLCLVSPETMIPKDHPLREIKKITDAVLDHLDDVFDSMYTSRGRPSVPPETLLKASILMALYSVRSERQFCEQLGYNLLFRWFLDMDMTEEPFDASTFSKNRERMLEFDVSGEFFHLVVQSCQSGGLMSREHFTVDGTLIEAWASLKSFKPKNGPKGPKAGSGSNREENFRGTKRKNDTHASTTDPEAKLMRKGFGKEAKLSFSAHALMENRNGLLVDFRIGDAGTSSEWELGLEMLASVETGAKPTVAGDRGYDVSRFVDGCRAHGFTPHVAQKTKHSRIDARTTRHVGYSVSQRIRKRVEEIFGWTKTFGGFRKTRYRGKQRTQMAAYLVGAAYNMMRAAKLAPSLA